MPAVLRCKTYVDLCVRARQSRVTDASRCICGERRRLAVVGFCVRQNGKLPPPTRWTITDKGRDAAEHAQLCVCDVKIMGILFACPDCGTVLGSVKDMQRPRAQRWTNASRR